MENNEVKNTQIDNTNTQAVEVKPNAVQNSIAPATPAYNNNLVNTGVILGTAALTLAAGTGLYFGLAKLTKIIKDRLNKKNEPTEEAPAEKEEPNKADED